MIIRLAQMEAFQKVAHGRFVEQMVAHVRRLAPDLAAVAKEEGVRAFVGATIDAARGAGFHNWECVRFYIECALVLGHRFVTDPQYPWANEIIHDPELTAEDLRADILWRYVSDYLEEVVGPDQAFALAGLHRLEERLGPAFDQLPFLDPDGILALVKSCYPEKYEYVGRAQLQLLLSVAAEVAISFGLEPSPATPVFLMVMICFGYGVVDDPLYPWVGKSLMDKAVSTPRERLEHLYDRSRAYLRHVSSRRASD